MEQVYELSDRRRRQEVRQNQVLRLVTDSFCRELIRYGIERKDLVSVSRYVLDAVLNPVSSRIGSTESIFQQLKVADIQLVDREYTLSDVLLQPLCANMIPLAASWLFPDEIRQSFVDPYPDRLDQLVSFLGDTESREYFVIYFRGSPVGLIGCEVTDSNAARVEMRKLIADPSMRGLGIGSRATFVWLHHAFEHKHFNKVFIHTFDTNVRNINLNRALGFQLEGVLYEEVAVNDERRDVLRMSLLRQNWLKARQ